ncbi:MAG: hypothetical protein MZU95_09445 [Desulfomicrobium escambiense]|nr:hypothetical protein [Desulfomicrobium escambiense]
MKTVLAVTGVGYMVGGLGLRHRPVPGPHPGPLGVGPPRRRHHCDGVARGAARVLQPPDGRPGRHRPHRPRSVPRAEPERRSPTWLLPRASSSRPSDDHSSTSGLPGNLPRSGSSRQRETLAGAGRGARARPPSRCWPVCCVLSSLLGGPGLDSGRPAVRRVPAPLVAHILGASTHVLVGILQVRAPPRPPALDWHRRTGRLLAVAGAARRGVGVLDDAVLRAEARHRWPARRAASGVRRGDDREPGPGRDHDPARRGRRSPRLDASVPTPSVSPRDAGPRRRYRSCSVRSRRGAARPRHGCGVGDRPRRRGVGDPPSERFCAVEPFRPRCPARRTGGSAVVTTTGPQVLSAPGRGAPGRVLVRVVQAIW